MKIVSYVTDLQGAFEFPGQDWMRHYATAARWYPTEWRGRIFRHGYAWNSKRFELT